MIFDLVKDFAAALEAMPREHPKHRILSLLEDALRRDVHFIARHPTTVFQCLWNACAWDTSGRDRVFYHMEQEVQARWNTILSGGSIWDGEQLIGYYSNTAGQTLAAAFGIDRCASVSRVLIEWEAARKQGGLQVPWLKSARPPRIPLASAVEPLFCDPEAAIEQIEAIPGGYLVIRAHAGRIHVLHQATGRVEAELASAEGKPFVIGPGGDRVAWFLRDGAPAVARLPLGEDITPAALSDSSLLAWQNEQKARMAASSCLDTACASNGRRSATRSGSRKVIELWELPERRHLGSFCLDCEVRLHGMSEGGDKVVVSDCERPFVVRVLDISGAPSRRYVVADDTVNCACFTDERTLVVGSNDRWCYKVDLACPDSAGMPWQPKVFCCGLGLSPCERLLVVESGDDESFVYDTVSGLPIYACLCHETKFHEQRRGRMLEVVTMEDMRGSEVRVDGMAVGWLPQRFSAHALGRMGPLVTGYETHIGIALHIYHLVGGHIVQGVSTRDGVPAFRELWEGWGRRHVAEFAAWLKALAAGLQRSRMEAYCALLEQEAGVWTDLGRDEAAASVREIASAARDLSRNSEGGQSTLETEPTSP